MIIIMWSFYKGWFTLATEAESESEESSDLVWISTTEAESQEKETLMILLTPIPSSVRLRLRFLSVWFTLARNASCAPNSDSAYDSVASVNQP